MSETMTSAWAPNALYGAFSGNNLYQTQQNALNVQKTQQDVGAANMEVVARAGLPLLDMKEEQAALAYGPLRQHLQSQGYGMNLPEQYPGHAATRQFVALGIPADKQFEYGAGRTAASGAASGLGLGGDGTTGAAPAPGAATAPPGGAGISENNFGNIRPVGATSGFNTYATPQEGIAAMSSNLAAYASKHGINTLNGLTARWAPKGDGNNDPVAYAAALGKTLGIDPNAEINLADPLLQTRLIPAMAAVEKGRPFNQPREVLTAGIQMGLGGAATPAPYRVAGQMQPPPGGAPGAAPATVQRETQVRGADGVVRTVVQTVPATAPPGRTETVEPETGLPVVSGPAAAPAAPVAAAPAPASAPAVAAQPPVAPAQPAAPQVPLAPVLPLKPSGLTAQQEQAALSALNAPGVTVARVNEITAHYQALAAQNRTYNEQAAQHNYERSRAAAADVETRAQHAATAAQRDIENKRAEAAAAALAEQRRLENARAGVPTGQQRNPATGVLEPIPGYRGATADERIDYSLKHDDPSSQDYADAWKARKWQIAPNGSVIEQDMSGYPPPTRSIQRPTFLPQPTGTALDEVRKADTDARVILPAIDRYVDMHKAIGGSSWGAYFDNPRDPKAQQLIGAFNAMKTVLRSPAYANTGVLQPAEMEMLKQELVSPQTIRGLYATPQALEARLHEIKFAILSRQDAELRSVGKDGVIVRDKTDLAKIPDGGKFYDEDGNLRVKTRAE